ncbi:hypothetical protein HT737_20430 [Pseudomonas sp. MD195_PC81_125]|nr:hypothetical protein [Pseudomonas sp. MD195_PC81_125]MBA5982100.1 hypothetical protein [Pseudomonas sp. MD195_PC81_125]
MSIVEQIVKNESVEDVLTVFALGSARPSLDRMFGALQIRNFIASG